ncbi:hypothetical protein C942_00270 [Photobacterium marinum]|uniref:Uncharacterized protein n=1 Tax=Photobacterium marinum TaxID=1056511 RepID=L8JKK1_9GAMM|nr:hypothetical protein [Photobacterium marinum]ELR67962.1 hypothetical protein C942_00270 [Photobacterium marinum]
MNMSQLNKLWSLIGTATLFYAVNAYSVSQGVNPISKAVLLDDRPIPGSYLAIFIISVMMLILTAIGRVYARNYSMDNWASSIPIFGFERLDYRSKLARRYQGAFLFFFIIFPLFSIIHFNNKVIQHGDIADESKQIVSRHDVFYNPGWDIVFSSSNFFSNFCMGQDLPQYSKSKNPCSKKKGQEGGVTWFIMISPLLMIGISLLVFFSVLDLILIIFFHRRIWLEKS